MSRGGATTAADAVSLVIGVAWKAGVLLLFLAVYRLVPHSESAFFVRPGSTFDGSLRAALSTWDAQHYLFLAEAGYEAGTRSSAFYPLLPLLLRGAARGVGDTLTAALILSVAASLVGLVYFRRVARVLAQTDPTGTSGPGAAPGRTPTLSTAWLIAFPTAFILSLPYSEALFFAGSAFWVFCLLERRWAGAAAMLVALPLVRPLGAFLVVPAAVFVLLELRAGRLEGSRRWLLLPWMPVVGFALYLLFMHVATGSPTSGFAASEGFGARFSIGSLLRPWEAVERLFGDDYTFHMLPRLPVDRIFFVLYLLALGASWRRLPTFLWVFSAVMGLVPALSGSYVSFPRYALMAYPVAWGLDRLAEGSRAWRIAAWTLLGPAVLVQILFATLHLNGWWVA